MTPNRHLSVLSGTRCTPVVTLNPDRLEFEEAQVNDQSNATPWLVKFPVGVLAGLCSTLFPPLIAIVSSPGRSDGIQIFTVTYIVAAILFSLLVGAVVTVFEWNVRRAPRETFMSALGIPALLAGAVNQVTAVGTLEQQVQATRDAQAELQKATEIDTLRPAAVEPIASRTGVVVPGFGFFPAAYASEHGQVEQIVQLGIRVVPQRQYVVLEQTRSASAAKERAAELDKQTGLQLQALRTQDGRYLVVVAGGPQDRSQALSTAIRIRDETGIRPSLMTAK